MLHVLDTLQEELERTHRLADTYKPSHIKSIFFSIFPRSFKKVFLQYADAKEELLLEYRHLHNDIDSKKIDPESTDFIKHGLYKISALIEIYSKLLSELIAHSHTQEEILSHEKTFFLWLLRSYQEDILSWVGNHEKWVFWENQTLTSEQNNISSTLESLKVKKQKLEEYMKNNS